MSMGRAVDRERLAQRHQLLAGGKYLAELTTIIGDEPEALRLLFVWTGMAEKFGGERQDFFTGPNPQTDAQRTKKLHAAAKHISALLPLLDKRTAWLVAVASPGFNEGPEVATAMEERLASLVHQLSELRADIERATGAIPPPKKGRQLQLTPRVMLLVSLIGSLKNLGVKFSDGENSKMVRAVRIFWQAAGFEGDPRDLVRSLKVANRGRN